MLRADTPDFECEPDALEWAVPGGALGRLVHGTRTVNELSARICEHTLPTHKPAEQMGCKTD